MWKTVVKENLIKKISMEFCTNMNACIPLERKHLQHVELDPRFPNDFAIRREIADECEEWQAP